MPSVYSGESLKTLVRSKFSSQQQAAVTDAKMISQNQLASALNLIDHSDLDKEVHAVGLVANEVIVNLASYVGVAAQVRRSSPLISLADNYFNLGFDEAAVARDCKHANYVSDSLMLRTHMSSAAPGLAREFRDSGEQVGRCTLRNAGPRLSEGCGGSHPPFSPAPAGSVAFLQHSAVLSAHHGETWSPR